MSAHECNGRETADTPSLPGSIGLGIMMTLRTDNGSGACSEILVRLVAGQRPASVLTLCEKSRRVFLCALPDIGIGMSVMSARADACASYRLS